MITYIADGDILESSCQTLVVPVNTVGAMGKGLALQFKLKYPRMFRAYRRACFQDEFKRKGYFIWNESASKKILCLPTKQHWRFPSKFEWIDLALQIVSEEYSDLKITSLAIPALGCGEGKLEWDDIRPLIENYFGHLKLPVHVYLPK